MLAPSTTFESRSHDAPSRRVRPRFRRPPELSLLVAVVLWSIASSAASATAGPQPGGDGGGWTVDSERSVFSLLTRKGGFAKGRAHDHLIVAEGFTATIEWSGDESAAAFSLRLRASDLDPDPDALRRRLAPRLAQLGLYEGKLQPISQKDRASVRETMLGRKQLDAERFPTISVRLAEVHAETSRAGSIELTHGGTIELTAHGETVELPFRARLEASEKILSVEAVAKLRFTQIGIEPYSAFLGAVKNLDEATLYLSLVAGRSETEEQIPPFARNP